VDGGPRSPLDVPVIHAQTVEAGRLALQPPATVSGADLAGDQREAVEHRAGPVRVIAPAGSGKTRTLGARLLHLTDDRRVEPRFVTAVAYNNRAAREMRERLQREDLHIRTIHSLGWAIIREVRPDATLLTGREVRSRLGAFIPKQPRPNTDVTGPYLEGLAEIMIALRDPDEVEGSRTDIEGLARIFPMYRALLARRNEVDYNEQNQAQIVGCRQSGERVPTSGMSDGSSDQLYLALRVAALEDFLAQSPQMPFVADDLFINFDDARAAAGFGVLAGLAQRCQVIFFTHHDHLAELAQQSLDFPVRVLPIGS